MRIVLTSTFAWPEVRRGGERYLHELAAAFASLDHDVRIVSTGPVPGTTEQLGVPVELLVRRAEGRKWGPQAWFGLDAWRHLRRDPPDVWHAFTIGDGAAASMLGSTTSVYTLLGPDAPVGAPWHIRRIHEVILRRGDAYLALSQAARARVRASTGVEVGVLGGGVDCARFQPGSREKRPTILFASDVDQAWKNADLLLDACAVLRSREPNLQVWLVGPGDAEALMARHPNVVDMVTRAGLVTAEELADCYGRAWVTALPSRGEAFGLVALESLACGTSAVALRGEGPADFIDASVGGLAEATVDSLATELENALSRGTDEGLREACRARALEHDWRTAVAPRALSLYSELQGAATR